MELFYCTDIRGDVCFLSPDESLHCAKVLRHVPGDGISVIDGRGNLLGCTILSASPKGVEARIDSETPAWGAHPYRLTLAVAPTKNTDRFEWAVEKAAEMGVDRIVPLQCRYSERKVLKEDRLQRILVSAVKQSQKALIPVLDPLTPVRDFLSAPSDGEPLRLIACCFEGEVPRLSVAQALSGYGGRDVTVMIGPEGDFSEDEVALAVSKGFVPVHLGPSRLRTETAAVTAAAAVYFRYMEESQCYESC